MARADPYGRRPEATVMVAEWVDPDDIRPNAAKSARTIRGFRSFCPIRRMAAMPATGVTIEHVMAADKLRELWDQVRVGFTAAGNPLMLAVLVSPQPRTGPNAGEIERAKSARALRRAVAILSLPEQALMSAIILQNQSIRYFCRSHTERTGFYLDQDVTKVRLMMVLNKLKDHFAGEIEEEVARGRRLAP
jgi:hypothetical protein